MHPMLLVGAGLLLWGAYVSEQKKSATRRALTSGKGKAAPKASNGALTALAQK